MLRLLCSGWLLLAVPAIAADPSWVQDVDEARTAIQKGNLSVAESYLDLAAKVVREEGNLDGRLGGAYEDLARAYQKKKLTIDAVRMLERAIVIWEETIGANQPKVAAILHQLATMHERQGAFSAAEPLRLRRIEILKKGVGDTHPSVAMAWGRLAGLYTKQSRLDDADKAYRAAFEILDHGTGPPHPALSRALRSYVVFLKKSGRHGEAVEFDAALRQLQGAVYRLGGGVTPPKLIEKREPESSEEARKLRIDGTVVMSVVIDEQGVPTAITVVAPAGFGMDEKAVEAVSAWRFQPAEKDGKPVAAVASIEVNFRIL